MAWIPLVAAAIPAIVQAMSSKDSNANVQAAGQDKLRNMREATNVLQAQRQKSAQTQLNQLANRMGGYQGAANVLASMYGPRGSIVPNVSPGGGGPRMAGGAAPLGGNTFGGPGVMQGGPPPVSPGLGGHPIVGPKPTPPPIHPGGGGSFIPPQLPPPMNPGLGGVPLSGPPPPMRGPPGGIGGAGLVGPQGPVLDPFRNIAFGNRTPPPGYGLSAVSKLFGGGPTPLNQGGGGTPIIWNAGGDLS
jgi:hypothetical protein